MSFSCRSRIVLQEPYVESSEWFTLGATFERNKYSPGVQVTPPLRLVWKKRFIAGTSLSPVVYSNVLFLPMLNGEIIALRIEDGRKVGEKKFSKTPINGLTLHDGILYFGLTDGRKTFFAYDIRTGRLRWSTGLGPVEGAPVLLDDNIYLGSLNHQFYCLERNSGNVIWKLRASAPISSSPALGLGIVAFLDREGMLYVVDIDSGNLLWQKEVGRSYSNPVTSGNKILVATLSGNIVVLDALTGRKLWSYVTGNPIFSSPTVHSSHVLVGTSAGVIRSLSSLDGSELWHTDTGSIINQEAILSGDYVLVASARGTLRMLDRDDGHVVWQDSVNHRIISPPIKYDRYVIIADDDKWVYVFRGSSHEVD